MVQIIHDLDLILHHVLPKTQAQDRCGSGEGTQTDAGHTDTETETGKHRHTDNDERCQLFSAVRDNASSLLGQLFLTLVRSIPFASVPSVAL